MSCGALSRLILAVLVAGLAGCKQSSVPLPPVQSAAAPAAAKPAAPPRKPAAKAPQTSPFWESAAVGTNDPDVGTGDAKSVTKVLPKPEINEARAAAAGIRKLTGKRLVLYTDLPSRPEIDSLCELADQAYPQWCEYFQVDPDAQPDWQMTGYLMGDRRKFQGTGLLPDNLPEFVYGFCRDNEFWVYEQPTDAYYRRHLLLHEMTHGFMYTWLRTSAPPWYLEGIAELLATHKLAEGKLQMNYFPQHREETPDWGRIKLVHEGFASGKAPFFSQVLSLPLEAHLKIEKYAWCWAAAALLDGHPRYRQRFRQVARDVTKPDFAGRFQELYADDWLNLDEEWQLFVGWMEYGYDLQRSAIDFKSGADLPAGGAKVKIAADRTWQSTGLRLQVGKQYRLRASGRYELAQVPQPWISEPNGVSIRYYKKGPLGILAAAVHPDSREAGDISVFFRAEFVGLELTITPTETGTLYLRINDSNAELADNRGELEVEVTPVQ